MHIRVKRQKTTIFLLTEPQHSVLEVKANLQPHLDGKDVADMRLVLVRTGVVMEDAKTLSDHKVQNDEIIGLCFKKGSSDEGEDEWEEVEIHEVGEPRGQQ